MLALHVMIKVLCSCN